MPQAIAYIAATVADFVAAYLGDAVFTAVYYATEVAVTVAISYAVNLAFAPSVPKPGAMQQPLKQSFAPRRSAFGEVRTSVLYSLFEAVGSTSVDVGALHDGQIDSFTRFYLNDDRVEVDAGTGGVWCPGDTRKYAYGGPPGDRTFMFTRLGLATETAYAQVTALLPSWGATHRGDGVASLALICKQSKREFQQEDFPNGVPGPGAAYKAQLVFDPRDEAQVQGDRSTYVWSDNPALCVLAYLTDAAGGMAFDYARRILPALSYWIAAADDCDADEATSTGTEKRYRLAGVYQHDNAPAEVLAAMLACFDGWLAERGDGVLVLRSGRYEAPTITFNDRKVLAYSIKHFQSDEQAINEVIPTFTDPDSEFTTVDAEAQRDEIDIAARGAVRSTQLDLAWCPSASQAVRLAKRRLSRAGQEVSGTITTNLYGMEALAERYIKLEVEDNAAIADLVVEITGPAQIDLAGLTVTFPFSSADVAIDDGDPGGGVTPPGVPDDRPVPTPLDAPTIDTLTAVYDDAGSGVAGARIQIDVTAPITADVQWRARWKLSAASDWHEADYSDIDDGAAVTLITGFVPAVGDVDVQVQYLTAAQSSPWSATGTITLAAPSFLATSIVASEDLAANDFVNVHAVAGVAKLRKADATDAGKFAHGFVLAAFTTGQTAAVHFSGVNPVPVASAAAQVFLSETVPGGFQAAGATTSGHILQKLGAAMPGIGVAFTYSDPIKRG